MECRGLASPRSTDKISQILDNMYIISDKRLDKSTIRGINQVCLQHTIKYTTYFLFHNILHLSVDFRFKGWTIVSISLFVWLCCVMFLIKENVSLFDLNCQIKFNVFLLLNLLEKMTKRFLLIPQTKLYVFCSVILPFSSFLFVFFNIFFRQSCRCFLSPFRCCHCCCHLQWAPWKYNFEDTRRKNFRRQNIVETLTNCRYISTSRDPILRRTDPPKVSTWKVLLRISF